MTILEFSDEVKERIKLLEKELKKDSYLSDTIKNEANRLFINGFKKYQKDPYLFIKTFFPQLTFFEDFQVEMCNLLRTKLFIENEKYLLYAASTAKGVGKTMFVSMIMAWALFCFETPNISITAPTIDTAKAVTLQTLITVLLNSRLGDFFVRQEMMVTVKPFGKIKLVDKRQSIRIIVASKKKVGAVQGRHAPLLLNSEDQSFNLSVVDEACSVDREVIEALKGASTTGTGALFLVGNPTNPEVSYLEDISTGDVRGWIYRQVSAYDMKRPDYNLGEVLKQYPDKGTEEYIRFVLGAFPKRDTFSGFFNSARLYEVLKLSRELVDFQGRVPLTHGTVIGVDISCGIGRDHTVAFARVGHEMELILYSAKMKPSTLAEYIKHWKSKGCVVAVDADGVGSSVLSELQDAPIKVEQIRTNNAPSAGKERFIFNKGSEIAHAFNEWLEHEDCRIFIPKVMDPLNSLIREMYHQSTIFTKEYKDGRMKCVRARGNSPDLIDAAKNTLPFGLGTDEKYKNMRERVPEKPEVDRHLLDNLRKNLNIKGGRYVY